MPIDEHQTQYIAPESDPDSFEAKVLPLLAAGTVFGIWGTGQSPEACFAELARLVPDVLDAYVMPDNGVGFSEEESTGWVVLTGPEGSAALSFGLTPDEPADLIKFGGPDVRPPFQLALVAGGRTHGALNAVLQNCNIVPLETMPGMNLVISDEMGTDLLERGWEKLEGDDDIYYLRREEVIFLTKWNDNHFGLFGWAQENTVEQPPYMLQSVFDRPALVQTIGRNDPLLQPDQLTAAAEELVRNL